MIKTILFSLALLVYGLVKGQKIERLDGTSISVKALEEKIHELMKEASVHGLALSVFNQNRAVYQKTFGYKNFSTQEPLKESTNLYGASLSKAVFAVLVMQLVEEGLLDPDRPLQSYLDQPIYEFKPLAKWHDNYTDLKQDSLYRKITARCAFHIPPASRTGDGMSRIRN